MHTDIDKTVIRIVQDYCFKNSAINLINEFVLTITPSLVVSIENGNLALSDLRKILQKRKDFFFANDLDINLFCKGLYKKLNYELSFYTDISFYKSILIFKQKVLLSIAGLAVTICCKGRATALPTKNPLSASTQRITDFRIPNFS